MFFVLTISSSYSQNDLPALKYRYFSEKLPGLTPKLFDPEIVSPEGLFEGGSFSRDMKIIVGETNLRPI